MSQLALFDIEVKYRSGRLNKVADTLSRCPEDENVDLQCTRNDKSDQLNEDDNNSWSMMTRIYISELNDVPVFRILDCEEIDEVVCSTPLPHNDQVAEEPWQSNVLPSFSFDELCKLHIYYL